MDPRDPVDTAYQKHMHELCRNIWLAFVAVLAVLFDIAPFIR